MAAPRPAQARRPFARGAAALALADWQIWSIIKSLFDGLMDYKPGTTEIVPDLAQSYEQVSAGRATRLGSVAAMQQSLTLSEFPDSVPQNYAGPTNLFPRKVPGQEKSRVRRPG